VETKGDCHGKSHVEIHKKKRGRKGIQGLVFNMKEKGKLECLGLRGGGGRINPGC